MPTISAHLKNGFETLSKAGLADPQREASSLLELALGRDKVFLIAHPEYEPTIDQEKRYNAILERRAAREPFQYIAGKQEFYGLDFVVTPDVLIPRPETEMLVERSIAVLIEHASPRFFEIGVGSGCISVSILKNVENATALGGDISDVALNVAAENAQMHGVGERMELLKADVFENVPREKFNLIVSNPPYIPLSDLSCLQAEVRDHEPHTALTDGGSGLSIIEKIVSGAPQFLMPGGLLLIEIGVGQAEAVNAMFQNGLWQEVSIEPDFQGIPRMVFSRLNKS